MSTTPEEANDRGENHGWSAANYAEAYGSEETSQQEAERRAAEEFPGADQQGLREEYVSGFLAGWEEYNDPEGR